MTDNSEKKLLPCPFPQCGGEGADKETKGIERVIECMDCGTAAFITVWQEPRHQPTPSDSELVELMKKEIREWKADQNAFTPYDVQIFCGGYKAALKALKPYLKGGE